VVSSRDEDWDPDRFQRCEWPGSQFCCYKYLAVEIYTSTYITLRILCRLILHITSFTGPTAYDIIDMRKDYWIAKAAWSSRLRVRLPLPSSPRHESENSGLIVFTGINYLPFPGKFEDIFPTGSVSTIGVGGSYNCASYISEYIGTVFKCRNPPFRISNKVHRCTFRPLKPLLLAPCVSRSRAITRAV
jgi:hypothetical protein